VGNQFSPVTVNLQTGTAFGAGGTDTLSNFENVVGTRGNDSLTGDAMNNILTGGAGSDSLIGGAGADTYVFDSTVGQATIFGFVSGTDKLCFTQSALPIGDGDTSVEGGVVVPGPGGFAPTAELVIVQTNAPFLSTNTAATAIGSATGSYAPGATALFAVDDNVSTGLFLFTSAGNDALVRATELTQLGTVSGVSATALGDYLF
ncbi:MAG: hypothetical protein FJZ47_07740, partial [Candidatus Tectomicrobia bacterium]|nr:hypothetical protein [Candidatus Tectomicrobia bacterium]